MPDRRRLELLNASAGNLTQQPELAVPVKLYLHFSGYDPRAAGGRQTIRLELLGKLPADIAILEVKMRSDLLENGITEKRLVRTASGQWQPLLLSFSSRNKEHGQYPIEVLLMHEQQVRAKRQWVCTSVILVPRADATLAEIHNVFLAVQKKVRVLAEDGAIATLGGLGQSGGYAQGSMHIEVSAKDSAIAKLEMHPPAGKYEIALGTIAWDEELIEVAADANSASGDSKTLASPPPAILRDVATRQWASLISDQLQTYSNIRLFALDEWVLGRMEKLHPQADILLCHRDDKAGKKTSLSRRISARHAIIRRSGKGVEITDVSRYGVLLNDICLEKGRAYPLQTGMRIEFCASVRGIVKLQVISIQPHVIILGDMIENSADADGVGSELLYLLNAETRPTSADVKSIEPLPTIFHFQGGFWTRDSSTLLESRLDANTDLSVLAQILPACHYCSSPYTGIDEYGIWRNSHIKI